MIEADKKREQIIEGAIKRFIHFGINKTTMNDIADDLSVSKPSLYYYFPDKKSLIIGVIEKIFNDYFATLKLKYNPTKKLEDTLIQTIDIRDSFFKKYYMLKITEGLPDILYNDEAIKKTLNDLKKIEKDFFKSIFNASAQKNEIEHEDIEHIAELYLESLVGFVTVCAMEAKGNLLPEKDSLKKVNEKQKELSRIFIKGLKPSLT
jgi:AcrR family transcriptional regulator